MEGHILSCVHAPDSKRNHIPTSNHLVHMQNPGPNAESHEPYHTEEYTRIHEMCMGAFASEWQTDWTLNSLKVID